MDDLPRTSPAAVAVAWTGLAVFMVSLNGGFVAFLWRMADRSQSMNKPRSAAP